MLAAVWSIHLMNRVLPPSLLPVPEIPVDGGVLLFAVALTLITGLVFGLAPAWHASRADLISVLKQGGRSALGAGGASARNLLVGAELALATVLLIGTGLLIQTLLHLEKVTLGFRPEGLLTFQVSPPEVRYPGVAKQWAFYRSLIAALESIPGARGAAVSSGLPMSGGSYTTTPALPVGPSLIPLDDAVAVDWRAVSPGYFRMLEIPLLQGRDFTEQDRPDAPPVMIVSRQTARRFWGAGNPLGRTVRLKSSGLQFTVVGVVSDVRNTTLALDPAPAVYFSALARNWPVMDVALRIAEALKRRFPPYAGKSTSWIQKWPSPQFAPWSNGFPSALRPLA